MARAPVPGRVKSRLAGTIGPHAAAQAYRALLADTLTRAAALDGSDAGSLGHLRLYLALEAPDGGDPEDEGDAALPPTPGWTRLRQRGDGLGARLAGVFRDLFAAGRSPVVIIGSDSPALPTTFLRQAFDRLAPPDRTAGPAPPPEPSDRGDARAEPPAPDDPGDAARPAGADVVLGPAFDGGYYLIGIGRRAWERSSPEIEALLQGSPMGTPRVAEHTRAAAAALGLAVAELPLWTDVDEPADLAQAGGLLGGLDAASVPAGRETAGRGAASRAATADHRAPAPSSRTPAPRGDPEGPLREVYLHVTHRCGTGCPQCYLRDARDPGLDRSRELTTDEWLRVIDEASALGASTFVIIGGDPFLRPDLFALIDHISGARSGRTRLFFNRPVDEDTAGRLAEVGRGGLTPLVSVDGTEAVNDSLRGAGNYAAAAASIRALLAAGLQPVVNTVLLRPVLPTLPELARRLAREGVRNVHLILPHQRGGLADHADLVPSGDELLAAVRALEAAAAQAGVTVDNLAAWKSRLRAPRDLCGAGCNLLAVDPEGLVHACPITCGDGGFTAGDLRREPLEEVWRRSPTLALLRASHARDRDECRDCPVVDACGGECWVQAHYAARARGERAGYLAPFPYCDLVRPVLEGLGAGRTATSAAPGRRPDTEADGPTPSVDLTPFDCI